MASSPCTPQAHGRTQSDAILQQSDTVNHPVNTLTEQLLSFTISKPKQKRDQTAATPASQSRPRTQRRTSPVGQENTPAQGADPTASRQENFTPSRLSCLSELQDELSCAVCLEICIRPCATPCGHAFCKSCLRQALQVKRQCPKCRANLPPASSWQPKVNTALWNTIQLLFPKHAAQAPPPTPDVQAASHGRRATATAGSSGQPRHRHMASVLAAGAAAGVFASDVSVRRSFRPPRPADASQDSRPRTRGQQLQQQMDQFVMPADLGAMLQDMYHTGPGPTSGRSSRGIFEQAASSQVRQPSSRQMQQQQASQGSNPSSRLRQAASDMGDSDDWDLFDFSILDDLPSQPATEYNNSTSSQQQPAQRQGRQQARAAAAARVHAAIAEDSNAVTAPDGYDYDEALRSAILASLHEPGVTQQAPAAAAVQNRRAQPAEAAGRRRGIQGSRRPQQQPSRQRSASLFGLMHSGRSPQQQWAVHSDDDVQLDDGLLDDDDHHHDPVLRVAGSNSHARSTAGAAEAAAPSMEIIDGLSELEDEVEVSSPVPGAQAQHLGPIAAPARHSSDAMAGGRRRHGRARVIIEDEEGDAGGALSVSGPGAQTQSALTSIADSRSVLGVGSTAQVMSADDAELEVEVLSVAPSPDPQPLAARLARFNHHPPERQQQRQPASIPTVNIQSQSLAEGPSIGHSQLLEQALSGPGPSSSSAAAGPHAITAAVAACSFAPDGSSRKHESRQREYPATAASAGQALDAAGIEDGESDDFEPITHRRLTAAVAARSVAGSGAMAISGNARGVPVGRVVAGLRRGAGAKQRR